MIKLAGHIQTRGISKSYGRFNALSDVSLDIAAGEFLTLLGPSGSGKTTFLMVLAGFEAPSAGAFELDGHDMRDTGPEHRGFGMVFQGYALFPHMSVFQNIAFPLKVRGLSRKDRQVQVNKMVELVGLEEHARKRPSTLSGGQQQRVALARALACEPPVLLLDEPFSALDKNLRGQMQDEMRRIHRELGTTFVFVTHDQSEALALSSHVAIFEAGRLQQFDTPDAVYERPKNRFVAEFLGDINVMEARLTGQGAEVESRMMHLRTIPEKEGVGHIAVRPEHVQLGLKPPHASLNALTGRLCDVVYQGSSVRLSIKTDSGQILLTHVPTDQVHGFLTPGAQLWASWKPERCFTL